MTIDESNGPSPAQRGSGRNETQARATPKASSSLDLFETTPSPVPHAVNIHRRLHDLHDFTLSLTAIRSFPYRRCLEQSTQNRFAYTPYLTTA